MLKFIAGYIWTQIQTTKHRLHVLFNIIDLINTLEPPDKWKLYRRGWSHDISKYRWSEAKYFAKSIFALKGLTYGTEKYKKALEDLRPALDHHYKTNRHHPEYHKNGINDMTEIDKLELIADWAAATKRHKDGNIFKSIEFNQKRYNYDDKMKEWLISMAIIIS